MRRNWSRTAFSILLGGVVVAISAAVARAVDPVPIEPQVARAEMELSTTGLTVAELSARQQSLHGWLMAEMPAGTLARSMSVELTDQERADLANVDFSASGPLRVGTVKSLTPEVAVTNLSPKLAARRAARMPSGVLRETTDGGFVWAAAITSPGAVGIRLHFSNFSIPDDADAYIFSLEGEAFGPYQRTGLSDNGDFWSHSINSDTAIVLVRHFGPTGAADIGRVSLSIPEIAHIAYGFGLSGVDGSVAAFCSYNEPCVVNTNCAGGQPGFISSVENAAAKMRWIAGCCVYLCSGGLIADTDTSTQIPYFLTANHCLNKNAQAGNLEAFFQYQTPCNGSCPEPYFDPHTGVARTLGATVKATGRSGDYTLLQLSQNPPSGSVFLGWTTANVANANGTNLYRISHPAGAPQAYSTQSVDTGAPTCQGWPRGERIYSRDTFGATEGGSSGSLVVNGSGQIVGQLTGACGFDLGNPCNAQDNATVDGAFAHYYPNVAPFLDPSPCNPSPEVCDNGADDDCDGATDCNDADCSGAPNCQGGGCVNPGGLPLGSPCTSNSQCCNNKCKGPPSGMTCR